MSSSAGFRCRYLTLRATPVGEAAETVFLAIALSFLLRLFLLEAFYIPSRSMETTLEPFDHIVVEKFSHRLLPPAHGAIVIFDLAALADAGLPWNPAAVPAHAATPASPEIDANPLERDAAERREYVKRVIGRGGDRIAFKDGQLLRNGEAVDEPYVAARTRLGMAGEQYALRLPGRRVTQNEAGVLIDGAPLAEALPAWLPASVIEDRSAANFVALKDGMIGVRRITIPKGSLYLLGDNRFESADSRHFGPVPETAVKGRALMTYWPPRRMRLL